MREFGLSEFIKRIHDLRVRQKVFVTRSWNTPRVTTCSRSYERQLLHFQATNMNVSVSDYLQKLEHTDPESFLIVRELRDKIQKMNPDISEEIKYGGILFSNEAPACGIFCYQKHVSLEFSHGASFVDANKRLSGNGKYRRHMKYHSTEDIDEQVLEEFISQI